MGVTLNLTDEEAEAVSEALQPIAQDSEYWLGEDYDDELQSVLGKLILNER